MALYIVYNYVTPVDRVAAVIPIERVTEKL